LLNLAGYKHAKVIGRILHRTESAVRYRLAVLGKSSRVHREGYARRALAEELHFGSRTIQRLIIEGLLEVRDPRITKRSLDDLCREMHRPAPSDESLVGVEANSAEPRVAAETFQDCDSPEVSKVDGVGALSTRASRAKRFWEEAAKALGVSVGAVEQYIVKGVLKLCDPRITERSLRRFCRRNGSLINSDFLNQETRAWLTDSMDFVPNAGRAEAVRFEASRKHSRIVRRCGCGRAIRGNAFFRHVNLNPA
jgi:hypothetical protein